MLPIESKNLEMEIAPRQKIMFVLPSLTAGGAERVMISFMNGLDRAQYEPLLLVINNQGPLLSIVDEGIPVLILGQTSPFVALNRMYLTIYQERPDVIVSCMAHMNFAVLMLRRKFPKIKFIIREATMPTYFLNDAGRSFISRRLIRLAYRVLYPRADALICPAQIMIDDFKSAIKPKVRAYKFLPNPVDVQALRECGFVRPKNHDHGIRLVCAGRLSRQKGYDRLLEALPKLQCDWHLTLIGDGDERQGLEAQIQRLGISKNLTMTGFMGTPWPLIAGADVFLLPSRVEGLPNAALEALACGTNVIAMSEAGGIHEIARHVSEEHLRIVDTMDNFIAAIEQIKPQSKVEMAESCLPPIYEKDRVLREFAGIIHEYAG